MGQVKSNSDIWCLLPLLSSIHLSIHLSIHVFIWFMCLSIYIIYSSIYLSISIIIYLSISICLYRSCSISFYFYLYLLSISTFISMCICLSISLSIYLSIYLADFTQSTRVSKEIMGVKNSSRHVSLSHEHWTKVLRSTKKGGRCWRWSLYSSYWCRCSRRHLPGLVIILPK